MKSFLYLSFILGVTMLLALPSCRKINVTTNPEDMLTFSVDTLKFDTVFTSRGTITRDFKVYNRNSNPIIISDIELAGGGNSAYRINVDAVFGSEHQEVRIEGKDSIYVFVEATIDPTVVDAPFLMKDSVIFTTNGNVQQVNLEAYGQNANYIGNSGELAVLSCSGASAIWDDPKPYVVLGFLIVDSCELIIEQGTDIHFQGGTVTAAIQGETVSLPSGVLFVTGNAHLEVNGVLNNGVRFLTDRIEPEFRDFPGQWGGIFLDAGSNGNTFDYAEIRNANVGIRVDSAADLTISNSKIYELTNTGILAVHSTITAINCLIFDVGKHNLQLEHGGTYNFYNCTFANVSSNHQEPILRASNYFVHPKANGTGHLEQNQADLYFENCIIYGTRSDEVVMDNPEEVTEDLNFTFEHCIIKSDTFDIGTSDFINVVDEDPIFSDANEYDYRLDTITSPAVDAGRVPTVSVPLDLEGNPRGMPIDIGAYEFQ